VGGGGGGGGGFGVGVVTDVTAHLVSSFYFGVYSKRTTCG